MFKAVLTENEDLCRRLIQAVLDKRVERIEHLDEEKAIQPSLDGLGARLDLLALVDGEYVDIGMQVNPEPDIASRCRFYHGALAARSMPKGSDCKLVPTSYVIFICLSDPMGSGLPRYELATTCINNPSVPVNDGALTLILNAQAWRQEDDEDARRY